MCSETHVGLDLQILTDVLIFRQNNYWVYKERNLKSTHLDLIKKKNKCYILIFYSLPLEL